MLPSKKKKTNGSDTIELKMYEISLYSISNMKLVFSINNELINKKIYIILTKRYRSSVAEFYNLWLHIQNILKI